MASRFDRNRQGLRTHVAVNRTSPKRTTATGTSARRYIADDATKDAIDKALPPGRSNDDHVVSKTTALNTLSIIAQRSADLVKGTLADVRASIELLDAADPGDSRASLPFVSDKDIENFESRKSKSIVDSIPGLAPKELSRIGSTASRIIREKSQSLIPKTDQGASQKAPLPAPEIDHVTVDLDKRRGSTDCFYARVVYSLPLDKVVSVGGKRAVLRGVRLFRAEMPIRGSRTVGTLSLTGVDKIRSNRTIRSKNSDALGKFELQLRQNGVQNAIGDLSPIDSNLNTRVSSEESVKNPFSELKSSAASGLQGDTRQTAAVSSLLGSGTGLSLDKSVAENLLVMRNIQVRERIAPDIFGDSLEVGRQLFTEAKGVGAEQVRQIQKNFDRSTTLVVDANNRSGFKEIAFLTPGLPGDDSNSKSKIIGDEIQYTFDDESISFGKNYQYYMVVVGSDMKESVRSRIVEITIDGMRIPERPRSVITSIDRNSVSLSISVDDQLVEKFEVYRRDVDVQLPKNFSIGARIVSDVKGFVSNIATKQKQANGFINVGEVSNATYRGGAIFRDVAIKSGRRYVYRIYSVDVFGNKSESPYEVPVFVVDSDRKNELGAPTVLAEVDSATNKIKVTFFSSDERITGFFLTRRDVSIRQNAFTAPGEVNIIKLGNPRTSYGSNNFDDVVLRGSEHVWTGYYPRLGKSSQVFVDQTVQFDRTYQYQIVGTDKFGNKTTPGFSRRVMVTRRPLVAAAVGLNAELVVTAGSVMGVKLSWEDGNVDVSPEDRVGDREALTNTSVRTLYQIERQKLGENIWKEFPMTEDREFFDVVNDFAPSPEPQSFRPEFLEKGTRYAYRIQAYQTGAFISNVTEPVEIIVDSPPAKPLNFQLTNPDTKVRPFYIMLNWDTDQISGVVDHWDIERAVVNNLAADRLNFKNPSENAKVAYKPFRTVFREASRFNSQTVDELRKGEDDPFGVIVGEHHFMDANVEFGQSYFYRIRAVSVEGTASPWSTKGIKISDPGFEKKKDSIVTRDEKATMSNFSNRVSIKSDLLRPSIETQDTSLSLLPGFAKDLSLNVATRPVLATPLSFNLPETKEISVVEAADLLPKITSPVVSAQISAAVDKVLSTAVITTTQPLISPTTSLLNNALKIPISTTPLIPTTSLSLSPTTSIKLPTTTTSTFTIKR